MSVVSMAAVARLVVQGSQVEAGEPKRIVTGYPGPAECTQCGMPVEPYDMAQFGSTGWCIVRLCPDCLDQEIDERVSVYRCGGSDE